MNKIIALLLWLALSPVGESQSLRPTNHSPVIAAGAFFALFVPDLEASTKWYSEKLGLKVVMRVPKQDKAAVAVLEGSGLIVELIQHDDALPLSKVTGGAKDSPLVYGIFKAGVIVNDFDKTLAMLKARNVEIAYGPFPARPNQRANVII